VKSTGDASLNRFLKALAIFQQLSAAISAIILAYAIGFAALCFLYIGKLKQTHKLHKQLAWRASGKYIDKRTTPPFSETFTHLGQFWARHSLSGVLSTSHFGWCTQNSITSHRTTSN
jgi:hypothetical protein